MDIDYKALLVKYIEHVTECEGTDFLSSGWYFDETIFSKDEWELLQELSK